MTQSKIIQLFFLSFFVCFTLGATPEEETPTVSQTIYDRLAALYVPSQAHNIPAEQAANEKIKQENIECFKEKKIYDVQLSNLQETEKLQLMYKLFSTIEKKNNPTLEEAAITSLYSAAHLFSGPQSNPTKNLFDTIDYTQTTAGKIELQKMLMEPLNTMLPLQERQAIIQMLIEDEELFNKLDAHLKNLAAAENELLWFWKEQDGPTQLMSDELYFKNFISRKFNQSPALLWLDSLRYNVVHHLLAAGIPLICASLFREAAQDATEEMLCNAGAVVLTLTAVAILYFYTIPKAKKFNTVSKKFQSKLIGASSYLRTLTTMCKDAKGKNLDKLLVTLKNFAASNSFQQEAKRLAFLLGTTTFTGKPSSFSIHGNIAVAYKLMLTAKHNLIKAIQGAGQLDAYLSIAKLYKAHAENPEAPFCFPQFVTKEKPQITAENFWTPTLEHQELSQNWINLGGDTKDALVTGKHSSGKTTVLKSFGLTMLLAQSFCIAPARLLTMTPFETILPYFEQAPLETEIALFQQYIDKITRLSENQLSLIILDEPFFAVDEQTKKVEIDTLTQTFAHFPNNTCILGTYATPPQCPTSFKQYHTTMANGIAKLKNGFGPQAHPAEILAKEGFKKQLLAAARELLINTPAQQKNS